MNYEPESIPPGFSFDRDFVAKVERIEDVAREAGSLIARHQLRGRLRVEHREIRRELGGWLVLTRDTLLAAAVAVHHSENRRRLADLAARAEWLLRDVRARLAPAEPCLAAGIAAQLAARPED